jgi:2',3'-cyclic-nucleotide 2'-phosphodiesterase/3'-nucleotidase
VSAVASIASIASPPATPALEPTAVASTAATEYTIVKGDNPYKIAKRFHVSYEQLVKFNNISDPRKMQIGEKIRIPKKS